MVDEWDRSTADEIERLSRGHATWWGSLLAAIADGATVATLSQVTVGQALEGTAGEAPAKYAGRLSAYLRASGWRDEPLWGSRATIYRALAKRRLSFKRLKRHLRGAP